MIRTLWLLTALHSDLEAYGAANGHYPICTDAPCLASHFPRLSDGHFRALDGWGRPLHVDVSAASYLVSSFGRDGKRDREWRGAIGWEPPVQEAEQVDNDLVLSNGDLLQYPWGTLAGWTSPPWGRDTCRQGEAGCGVLHIQIAFQHWPAPIVQLCDDRSLVAELWHPGPITFRAVAGAYTLAVYWPDNKRVSLTSVHVEPDIVSAVSLEAPPPVTYRPR